jgi:hypothetical protein
MRPRTFIPGLAVVADLPMVAGSPVRLSLVRAESEVLPAAQSVINSSENDQQEAPTYDDSEGSEPSVHDNVHDQDISVQGSEPEDVDDIILDLLEAVADAQNEQDDVDGVDEIENSAPINVLADVIPDQVVPNVQKE